MHLSRVLFDNFGWQKHVKAPSSSSYPEAIGPHSRFESTWQNLGVVNHFKHPDKMHSITAMTWKHKCCQSPYQLKFQLTVYVLVLLDILAT